MTQAGGMTLSNSGYAVAMNTPTVTLAAAGSNMAASVAPGFEVGTATLRADLKKHCRTSGRGRPHGPPRHAGADVPSGSTAPRELRALTGGGHWA